MKVDELKKALFEDLQNLDKVCKASSDPPVRSGCENIHLAFDIAMKAAEDCKLARSLGALWMASNMAGSFSDIDYLPEAQEIMKQADNISRFMNKYVVKMLNERCGCKIE